MIDQFNIALILPEPPKGVIASGLSSPADSFSGAFKMKTIPLTQGQVAIVDAEDYEELSKHKWCAVKTRYGDYVAVRHPPRANGKQELEYMHRRILGLKPGDKRQGDHKNHNRLDNRRKTNLRICSRAENQHNYISKKGSSRFKGVCWYKRDKKWCAYIHVNGKKIHLGYFNSEVEAALAYDRAAIQYFGKFACLNFKRRIG